jgi:iron complex outermembrane receptor protein
MINRLHKTLLLGASPVLLLLACNVAANAQSTGTQEIETVVVRNQTQLSNGLMGAQPVSKESSTITNAYLTAAMPSGQTVFNALNFMPGVNFTNNDPYGSSGGNIRMHGQDGNHISLTFDGMPLNDTGNYAIYTNQMPDAEIVDRISANQGSTDVDSPTAAATGGVIAIVSDRPHDDFGASLVLSGGSYSDQRYFGRVDSGTFGPWDTRAFATFSWQDYDKFKGPGQLRKYQANFKIQQDIGTLGWITFAGHWNNNRNNSYYGLDYAPNTAGWAGTSGSPPAGGGPNPSFIDLIKNPNGSGYVPNPLSLNSSSFSGNGWNRDYLATCAYTAPTAGVADSTMTGCGNWYKGKINPSDTGNLRMQSLWRLADTLTLTVDANLQYVLANGGGLFSFAETNGQLAGGTPFTTGAPATLVTPYGCIPGKGCDLNGDGDLRDNVELYQPSTTNTRRWGFSTSLIYQLDSDNYIQAAYTLDYGLHRQTGTTSFIDPVSGPYDPFAGLKDKAHEVNGADGVPLRYRDRKSKAILNQAAFDYEGQYLDGSLRASLGFRLPFMERDLNQYCYEQAGSSNAYCTSQTPTAYNPTTNTYTLPGGTAAAGYVAPGSTVKRYTRFLPHLGLTYLPFGDEHQFFGSYTQEIAAPRTDNLYQSQKDASGKYTTFLNTKPETSTTYQLGYRYLTDSLQTSVVLWNSQVKNRIVSSFDQTTNAYFDHNVPGVNFWGVDFESNWSVTDKLSLYANAGYDRARIISDIPVGGGSAPTYDKQLSEVPKWTLSGRAQYAIFSDLRVGAGIKYVSRRNQTEDNNAFVPDYFTVNADVNYDLDLFGMKTSSLRLNVDNLFDKHYFSSLGTQTCWTPLSGQVVSGCTTIPYAYLGSPRTIQVTLTTRL